MLYIFTNVFILKSPISAEDTFIWNKFWKTEIQLDSAKNVCSGPGGTDLLNASVYWFIGSDPFIFAVSIGIDIENDFMQGIKFW